MPGPLGGRVLAFVFLAIAEYLVAPPLLGLTNFAGTWSTVGAGLFGALILSVGLFVLRPLRPVFEKILADPSDRRPFLLLALGGFLLGLFATSSLQIVPAGSPYGGPLGYSAGWTTVYSPLGAWPSFGFTLGALGLAGSIDPVVIALLGLLAVIWSVSVTLEIHRSRRCDRSRDPSAGSRSRWVAMAVWAPSGFMTGCPSCAPLALTALGLVIPGAAASGYAFEPLVPWMGLDGILYLASLGLTILLLRRATRPEAGGPEEPGTEAPGP
ncbi:MAG TPA: hypothetical protein VGS23_02640 [Thermoplasmata archaeon]|nr:hypothetical protein [Thermoplasmata archaeon]